MYYGKESYNIGFLSILNHFVFSIALLFITPEIQNGIEEKLKRIILPKTAFEIEHRWAGIMGIGNKKEPIIKRLDARVCIGVGMGGMGVAIGTLVGQRLAEICE